MGALDDLAKPQASPTPALDALARPTASPALDALAHPNPLADPLRAIAGAARHGQHMMTLAGQDPLGALDNVLETPAHLLHGFVSGKGRPNTQAEDDKMTDSIVDQFLPGLLHNNNPGLIPAKTMARFAAGTATDPLSFIPGSLIEKTGAKLLGPLAKAISKSPVGQGAKSLLESYPELHALTPEARRQVIGIKQSEAQRMMPQAVEDKNLLKAAKKDLKAGKVSPEVRQRLLREAYTHGTPQMQAEAVRLGYKPTGTEVHEPLLEYNVAEDYQPAYSKTRLEDAEPGFLDLGKSTPGSAAFEKHKLAEPEEPLPLEQAIPRRLDAGRRAVTDRRVIARISEELGIPADEAKKLITEQRLGRLAPLGKLSDLSKWGLVSTNPLPHAANIATLAFLAGGERGLGKTLATAVKGATPETLDAMQQGGAGATAFSEHGWEPLGFKGFSLAQGFLDRLDQAARATRWEEVAAAHPDWDKYQIADEVRNTIGDYAGSSTSRLNKGLRAIGGEFPGWRNSIVPKAVGRAIVRNPARVERYVRAKRDVDESLPFDVDPGGPINNFARMAFDPLGYGGSPSTVGPGIGAMVSQYNDRLHPRAFDALPKAVESFTNMLPGGTFLNAISNERKAPGSIPTRLALSLLGAHTAHKPKQSDLTMLELMDRLGINENQARELMR